MCIDATNERSSKEKYYYSTLALKLNDIPTIPQNQKDIEFWYLTVLIRLPNDNNEKKIRIPGLYRSNQRINALFCQDITKVLRDLSHFVQINKSSLEWEPIEYYQGLPEFRFNLLAEELQDSAEYVMLTGITFGVGGKPFSSPYYIVIKNNGNYYKAIGTCIVSFAELLFTNYKQPEEQTFKIE